MQGYEIKSDLLKTRFNMSALFIIKSKLLCKFTVKADNPCQESVIRSFEKGKIFV